MLMRMGVVVAGSRIRVLRGGSSGGTEGSQATAKGSFSYLHASYTLAHQFENFICLGRSLGSGKESFEIGTIWVDGRRACCTARTTICYGKSTCRSCTAAVLEHFRVRASRFFFPVHDHYFPCSSCLFVIEKENAE